ncbi:hypothetical protein O3X23_41115 [Streptomyces sp. H39-S7]|nr:hypothetical protein [Streptomyces sp. H39-S7]
MEAAERRALGDLCRELPWLRREWAFLTVESRSLLERIEEEARARRPILHLLHELLGTDRAESRQALSAALPGAGPGQAVEERFLCPDGACDRKASSPHPAGPVPRCALVNQPMCGQ